MFRFLFFLLAFVLSLSALSDSEILKRADGFMKTSNKSDQFRAYNDYKNLYLRALMDEDNKLRLSALSGIVSSGKKLHIDVSQYSQELSKSKPKTSYNAPTPKANPKSKSKKKLR